MALTTALSCFAAAKGAFAARAVLCGRVTVKMLFPYLQDPLAIMGVIGILLPFIIVGVLVALGVIDPNPTGKAR